MAVINHTEIEKFRSESLARFSGMGRVHFRGVSGQVPTATAVALAYAQSAVGLFVRAGLLTSEQADAVVFDTHEPGSDVATEY